MLKKTILGSSHRENGIIMGRHRDEGRLGEADGHKRMTVAAEG